MNIKLTKKKSVDRVITDLNGAIEQLKQINEREVELIPDKYLKQLARTTEIIVVVADMLSDMEYEG